MGLESPCREWQGALTYNGYGIRTRQSRETGTKLVHRQMWALVHGPIPEGMIIMHRCDNRKCFRLDHLRLGTVADNQRDMAEKGRGRQRVLPDDAPCPHCGKPRRRAPDGRLRCDPCHSVEVRQHRGGQ